MTVLLATPLFGQSIPASAPLPAGHWAHDALGRLADAGLLYGVWTPGTRPTSQALAAVAFDSAAARAARTSALLDGFARSIARRFGEEQGVGGGGRELTLRSALSLELSGEAARATAAGRLELTLADRLAVMAAPAVGAGGGDARGWSVTLPTAAVTAAAGPLRIDLARTGFRLGPGEGGLLLHEAAALNALVVRTEGPRRPPGVLELLGPVDATVLATRIPAVTVDTSGTDPWLLASRLSVSPHPRLRLGVNRVITGVTRWHGETFGPREALYVAGGKHTHFDDQKASVDATLLFDPLGLPVSAYGELGFEDSAGGLYEDPGLLLGLHLPRLPGLPLASLRWEYTAFGEAACFSSGCGSRRGNWFYHPLSRRLHATADGVPLGHPLGGYGSEHRVRAGVWLADARLQLGGTGFLRRREEGNLLYIDGAAGSIGLALDADWQLRPRWLLELTFEVESHGSVTDPWLGVTINRFGG